MEQYFVEIESKNGKIAFYNDKTSLLSSFNSTFDMISKPKISIYSALSLKEAIDQAVYILNRYYYLKGAYIVDINQNIVFNIQRDNLKDFLEFYKK